MGASGIGELALRGPRWTRGALIALIVGAVAVGLAGARPAVAATTTVQAGQQNGGTLAANQFNAAAVTIAAGDTVHWVWFSNAFGHTVTSYKETGGVPDWQTPAPLTGSGQSFDHTFSTGGVFTYYFSIHALRTDADPANIDASIAAGKMVGKVTVTSTSVGGLASRPDIAALNAQKAASSGGNGWRSATLLALIGGTVVSAALYVVVRRARRDRVAASERTSD